MTKRMLTLLVVTLIAGSAMAQALDTTIYDIRTGLVPTGTEVNVSGAVVTAIRYNGFSCTELPAGPYTAIWVYTGTAPEVAIGDIVDIASAEYIEYYDLSELKMATFGGTVTVTGTTTPPVLEMTVADVQLDDEAWESHVLTLTDGFMVTEMLSYGQWNAQSVDSDLVMLFDDYFFDETVLFAGACYNGVVGMYTYNYGSYKLNPLVDGLTVVDCTIANDEVSFGQLKALYR